MMTYEEIYALFPNGALVIPREEGRGSFKVDVSPGAYEPDEEAVVFSAWLSPYHDIEFSRDLKKQGDGWLTTGSGGAVFFLRPLEEPFHA